MNRPESGLILAIRADGQLVSFSHHLGEPGLTRHLLDQFSSQDDAPYIPEIRQEHQPYLTNQLLTIAAPSASPPICILDQSQRWIGRQQTQR